MKEQLKGDPLGGQGHEPVADLMQLPEVITTAARGRGVASVAVIQSAGAAARAAWVPESEQEPAFLAYSITKTFTAVMILTLCEAGQLRLEDRLVRWVRDESDRGTLQRRKRGLRCARSFGRRW